MYIYIYTHDKYNDTHNNINNNCTKYNNSND